MKNFQEFLLIEASVNKHMTHLQDNVIELGSAGIDATLRVIEDLGMQLSGSGGVNKLTLKWDGAPALWAGYDPQNGKFFVGTKSLFNKNPKINYTTADVKENHKGVLADKLIVALKELKPLWKQGMPIFQGDMMFTKGDLNTDTIDGETYTTFQPNTLRYAVPADSDLSKTMKKANLGIVFHTTYSGPDLQNLSASFGADVSDLKKSSKVWYQDAEFSVSQGAYFSKDEAKMFNKLNSKAKLKAKKINKKFIDELSKSSQLKLFVNTHINARVRVGEVITDAKAHMKNFYEWLTIKFDKEIAKLKSDKGKEKKAINHKEIMKLIKSKEQSLISLYEFQSVMVEITTLFEMHLKKVKQIPTFVQKTPGVFSVVSPEGFVAVDKLTGNAVKIVDRLSFSANNFNIPKDWS